MSNCKYGFYTCYFKGQIDFCNTCDDGQNYQMKEESKKHGGVRPGAGRKKGEPTTTIAFRVKTKYAAKIKKVVKAEIKRLEGDG